MGAAAVEQRACRQADCRGDADPFHRVRKHVLPGKNTGGPPGAKSEFFPACRFLKESSANFEFGVAQRVRVGEGPGGVRRTRIQTNTEGKIWQAHISSSHGRSPVLCWDSHSSR